MGRSVPRLEAREKVTGRAEYVHNLRLPGMLTARSRAARLRMAASSASTRALRCGRGRVRGDHRRGHPQDRARAILRPRVPRPAGAGAGARCVTSASRSRRAGPRSPRGRAGGATGRGAVRGAAAGLRRGRGDDLGGRSCTTF